MLGTDLDAIGGNEFRALDSDEAEHPAQIGFQVLAERDGLVTRTMFPTIPPRVDYELTDLGRGLAQPVQALGTWAFEHLPEIQGARTSFDARNDKN
jgi:hypothetical protein